MPEQDAGTLTTLTVTTPERKILQEALAVSAAMQDALGDVAGAKRTLNLWGRVCPDYAN